MTLVESSPGVTLGAAHPAPKIIGLAGLAIKQAYVIGFQGL